MNDNAEYERGYQQATKDYNTSGKTFAQLELAWERSSQGDQYDTGYYAGLKAARRAQWRRNAH